MAGRRIALGLVIAMAALLAGCATPITNAATNTGPVVSQIGLLGKQVALPADHRCYDSFSLGHAVRLMNASQTKDIQVPPLVRIDVGCHSSTQAAVIKRWALALATPDDPGLCNVSILFSPPPDTVGTSADGSTWLLRVPQGRCAFLPSIRARVPYQHLSETGHL